MIPLYISDFEDYFRAVWGREPFPWQVRLARTAWAQGRFPAVLDLPTGAGKTAVIDVAVFLLALDEGRRFPHRVALVVDRRVVVDQAAERARNLAGQLEAAREGVLRAVAQRLSALSGDARPLHVATLRGGMARDDTWARDPAWPLVIASTVDQVGSRLLFRGYGVPQGALPIHAGLLGNDLLLLLDEVHQSEPFRQTVRAVETWFRGARPDVPDRWQVVEMSATPAESGEPFRLESADVEHPVLARRVSARKPSATRQVEVKGSEAARRVALARAAVDEALVLQDDLHPTVAVVVNRVDTARAAMQLLRRTGVDGLLLTGRSRPLDREAALQGALPRIAAGRERGSAVPPLVVVATQCIEAGADFDFDGLVTECASLDALRQRFGRLDRLGDLAAAGTPAAGVVLGRSDQVTEGFEDAVYGGALARTWAWLAGQAELDMGIGGTPVPDDLLPLLAPRPDAPVLLPAHLDLWCQTRPQPQADPDPSLWLHGKGRGAPEVLVVWRADLDADLLSRDEAAAIGIVAACPPGTAEAMSLPLWAVRRWLGGMETPEVEDLGLTIDSDALRGEMRPALAWRGDDSAAVLAPDDIRPGDTLVVPASYGGIADGNWDPEARHPVVDLGHRIQPTLRRRAVLRLHPALLPSGCGVPPTPRTAVTGDEELNDDQRVTAYLEELRALAPDDWPERPVLEALLGARWRLLTRVGPEGSPWWVVSAPLAGRGAEGAGADFESADESASFVARLVDLDAHLRGVGALAREMGRRCGLPSDLVEAVGLAGDLHDVGKADPRFQRMLAGGDEVEAALRRADGRLLAKSDIPPWDRRRRQQAQVLSGYPPGTRHELLSAALLEDRVLDLVGGEPSLADIVLHLVASHHGWARPFGPAVLEKASLPVELDASGVRLAGRTDHAATRLDGGVPDRFWRLQRRFGWWGVAWLEAVLRLADQRRSELESRGGAA